MTTAVGHYFGSSIGRKQLIAITGLALCGFLISHLTGNFLLLVGPEAFNVYAHKLASLGVLLYLAEVGLLVAFIIHLGLALKITLENKAARPVKYYVKKNTGRGTTFMSATMPYTGFVLLAFVITHLLGIKFGTYYTTLVDGVEMRDVYRTTIEHFSSVGYTAWYSFAMICAAIHTCHGFASAFQTLGLNHPRYFGKVKLLSLVYAIVVGGGFAFLAIWSHLKGV